VKDPNLPGSGKGIAEHQRLCVEKDKAGANPERMGELFQAGSHEDLSGEDRRMDVNKNKDIRPEDLENGKTDTATCESSE